MKKLKYPYCLLRIPCFHWKGPKPILSFLLKVMKGIFPLFLNRYFTYIYTDPLKKEFFFDLGSNGYQVNISLIWTSCFAAEGQTTFFYFILMIFSEFLLSPAPLASKDELEKQEFIISVFSSCHHWVVYQEGLSGILRWHGNAPKVNSSCIAS